MRSAPRWVVMVVLLSVVFPPTASSAVAPATPTAQSDVLPPIAYDYLPDGDAIGDDWLQLPPGNINPLPDGADGSEIAVYLGPYGARIWIAIATVSPDSGGPFATYQAMRQHMTDWFVARLRTTAGRSTEIEENPKPKGCIQAERMDGTDIDWQAAGVTICATERVVIFTYVSGFLRTSNSLAIGGWEASDYVVERCLEEASQA